MLIGKGGIEGCLDSDDVWAAVIQGFQQVDVRNRRVLVIIPDPTRAGPIPMFFRAFYSALCDPSAEPFLGKAAALHYLVASGKGEPLGEEELNRLVGISAEQRAATYRDIRISSHRWDDPDAVTSIGTISADEISSLTGGRMAQDLPVGVNRTIFDYDVLVICGPTFPDAVAGFVGGNEYLFPGIAGPEMVDFVNSLAAQVAGGELRNVRATPQQAVIDRAAAMIERPKLCFSLVVRPDVNMHEEGTGKITQPGSTVAVKVTGEAVTDRPCLVGLFCGTPAEAFPAAAELASQLYAAYPTNQQP
jgi:nickel-dependent lactate racemase